MSEAASPLPETVVEVRGLRKAYGAVEILKGVDLTVRRGEVVVLMGSSGSGKSTLLRCLNRLTDPDAGQVTIAGFDMTGPSTNLPLARRRIGFVAQHFNLYPHMSVVANVMEGPRTVLRVGPAQARDRAVRLLERVGLAAKLDAYPRHLSGGQQQRVAIARALAMEPEVMLFDEPTSALDPELTGDVLDTMKELADEGMTMVVVSHEVHFASRVATRLVMMDGGQVVEEGGPRSLLTNPGEPRTRQFLGRLLSWETDIPVA